jgi:hypothetical protein
MKPLVPVHDRKMFIKSFTVKSRQDLWRVCHKAPRSNFPTRMLTNKHYGATL